MGSGSGECATSEPTCNPENAPGTTPAPTSQLGECHAFPVYGADADPGQGLFWITVTAKGVCFQQASFSDVGSGPPPRPSSSFDDPLTSTNVPPDGFYDVFPGYGASPWTFTPVVSR